MGAITVPWSFSLLSHPFLKSSRSGCNRDKESFNRRRPLEIPNRPFVAGSESPRWRRPPGKRNRLDAKPLRAGAGDFRRSCQKATTHRETEGRASKAQRRDNDLAVPRFGLASSGAAESPSGRESFARTSRVDDPLLSLRFGRGGAGGGQHNAGCNCHRVGYL